MTWVAPIAMHQSPGEYGKTKMADWISIFYLLPTQELDVNIFSVLVYPLRSKGKDGHSAAAQIVSG